MKRSSRAAWWLLSPMLAMVAVFAVYPVGRMLVLSLFAQNLETNLLPVFSGFDNFLRVAGDGHFWQTVSRTLLFAGLAVGSELALGLASALAIHHSAVGRGLARTVALVPWVLPTSALALAWIWIFNDQFGVFNDLLQRLGVLREPFPWLGRPRAAFFALVMADVWKTTPFMMLLLLAGLQTIPAQLYEAAAIDGGSRWQRFRSITLPLLRPTIFVAVVFRALQSFGIFDLVYVMTGGGPGGATETVALYTYRNFMRYLDFGYGAALLVTGSVLLMVLTGAIWLALGREGRPA
ncbi:MAG: sugar ABC transporter permease [Terrimicrobiaceae bacterium]|jgi:multiple sugar transport system permease protein|nr:sugar ABC transporter permease [Terrimicrobiaceae bacterium]